MRTIKRYSNRKLYDTQEKRYLTLQHLGDLVSKGEKIQVVDNDSGKDITGQVLSKALLDKEREAGGGILPTELFRTLLQGKPNQILDYLRTSWKTGIDQLRDFEGEIDKRFKGFLESGKMTSQDAMKLRDSLMEGLRERWRSLETSLEAGIESAVGAMPVASRKDVDRIERQIEELTERIEALAEADGAAKPKARRKSARKAPARKKKASKKAPAKKRAASKKRAAKKAPAKKRTTKKKAAPKKRTAKKAPARKKAAPKKRVARKAPAKKKAAAKKRSAKKAPAKRKPAKKAAKKTASRRRKR